MHYTLRRKKDKEEQDGISILVCIRRKKNATILINLIYFENKLIKL